MENTATNKQTYRPDRHGENNPMWGRRHSSITRQKQSDAAIRRNQQYKKALDAQQHLTMDDFLSNNPSVEQYISALASKVIKEEIDKFVKTQCETRKTTFPKDIWL